MGRKRSELPENLRKHISPKATSADINLAEEVYKVGLRDGELMGYGKILSLLESKYLADDAPRRGTPEAIAILELAKELGNHLREQIENANQS